METNLLQMHGLRMRSITRPPQQAGREEYARPSLMMLMVCGWAESSTASWPLALWAAAHPPYLISLQPHFFPLPAPALLPRALSPTVESIRPARMLAVSSRPSTRIARRCLSLTTPTRNGQSHRCLILLRKLGADSLRSSLISVPAARRTVVRLVLVRCVLSPPFSRSLSPSSFYPPKLTTSSSIPILSRPPPSPQQLPVLLPRPLLGGPTRPLPQARPGAEAGQRVQSGSSRRSFVRFHFFPLPSCLRSFFFFSPPTGCQWENREKQKNSTS